jgi:hypothetical protein
MGERKRTMTLISELCDGVIRSLWKTYTTSVKNNFPLGCTLMSFNELNWRPKKLFSNTVTLCGGFGLTRAIDGGRGPRPDVISNKEDLYGPVPPFVI